MNFNIVGDWQVSSSTDVSQEPSTEEGSWEKKKNITSNGHNTVNELFKMSHNGYSAPVSTWNNTRSQLDKEIHNEKREERKRTINDPADQGKIKHQKINSNNSYKSNPGYNPIQVGNYFHNLNMFVFRFLHFKWL